MNMCMHTNHITLSLMQIFKENSVISLRHYSLPVQWYYELSTMHHTIEIQRVNMCMFE